MLSTSGFLFAKTPHCLVDRKNKIIFQLTEKAGCTIITKMFFYQLGILKTAQKYHPWIHNYKWKIFIPKHVVYNKDLLNPEFRSFKFVRNPYNRAVSSYLHLPKIKDYQNLDISFFEFLKKIGRGIIRNSHWKLQKIKPLEDSYPKIWTKVIKIEELDKGLKKIKKITGIQYSNKFNSNHHQKIDSKNHQFVGKTKRSLIKSIPPYQYFYDSQIRTHVEHIYKDDIKTYGYQYPF